jgi:hypothetical protein
MAGIGGRIYKKIETGQREKILTSYPFFAANTLMKAHLTLI